MSGKNVKNTAEVSVGDRTVLSAEKAPERKKAVIGEAEVRLAREKLEEYRKYKHAYDEQVRENEEWWKLNHWKYLRIQKKTRDVEPTSAWTFNTVLNKHADMMDNIPESQVLPREKSDAEQAKILTSVLPVINERCDFERTYYRNSYSKIKNGIAVYSVIWKDDEGLGDISIEKVDILNLFWEPEICDLQASANVFLVNLVSNEVLESEYPELSGKLGSPDITVVRYESQPPEEDAKKSAVVDWYYKKNGKLHFCKFCGETVLFSSENADGYEDGFYAHGKYPFVIDGMYPLEGSLFHIGEIEICRNPQTYIDKLDGAVLENLKWQTKPRWFASKSCGINTDDFENMEKSIVWVEGNISEERLRQIKTDDISAMVYNWKQAKIDELKETSSNRDVSQGSTSGGVTSGLAIATLQEAGNKTSRDIISESYRAFYEIEKIEIELIRQFYTEERVFRITGEDGMSDEFITFSNAKLKPDALSGKMPMFDLKIRAKKKSPFSQTAMNETAMNLYSAGFFAPENAQAASAALEMMDFEGIDAVRRRVSEGATLYNQIQQMQQQLVQMAQMLQILTSRDGQAGQAASPYPSAGPTPSLSSGGNTATRNSAPVANDPGMRAKHTSGVSEARSRAEDLAANGYSRALIERARPDVG